MATANEFEAMVRKEDDYELMVRFANDEDEGGMVYLAQTLGAQISADVAWELIDRYKTRGSAA